MGALTASQVLVIGGTGFVGRAVVDRLLATGHRPTLFNRGRTPPLPGVDQLRGDREAGDYTALRAGRWDAVVDVIGYLPRHVNGIWQERPARGDQGLSRWAPGIADRLRFDPDCCCRSKSGPHRITSTTNPVATTHPHARRPSAQCSERHRAAPMPTATDPSPAVVLATGTRALATGRTPRR
jgi:NAD-dependent epimerase/dehydratase family protein